MTTADLCPQRVLWNKNTLRVFPLTPTISHFPGSVNFKLLGLHSCTIYVIILSIINNRHTGGQPRNRGLSAFSQENLFVPRLSVPLTDEQHRAIRLKAAGLGVPQAEVARRFLLAWTLGLLDMPVYREMTELDQTIEQINEERSELLKREMGTPR